MVRCAFLGASGATNQGARVRYESHSSACSKTCLSVSSSRFAARECTVWPVSENNFMANRIGKVEALSVIRGIHLWKRRTRLASGLASLEKSVRVL
jgi:hypothetical protein